MSQNNASNDTSDNPLLTDHWDTPFGLPPFSQIEPQHFAPAFAEAFSLHLSEIKAITSNREAATFANTIAAFERSGDLLSRTARIFYNLASSNTNDALQAIERELAPKFAQHRSAIYMDAALFQRIDTVSEGQDSANLNDEQTRVLELIRRDFIRSGAQLDESERKELAAILEKQAGLTTNFSQNILKDEAAYLLPLDKDEDLAGLPSSLLASAKATAGERETDAPYAVTASRTHTDPFLQYAERRDLREQLHHAWTMRGDQGSETDNKKNIAELIALRARRAKLLGYKTFADYKLDNTMAKTAGNVRKLLDQVWTAGRSKALEERGSLQEMANGEGANFNIAAHDWRFYTEKLRKSRYDLDEQELKPYFELEQVRAAAFYVAGKLFGLTFEEQKNLDLQHPDARGYEVKDSAGNHVALFVTDDFARSSKRSGAWMSAFRSQQKLDGDIRPIVCNTLNIGKPGPGEPVLLSLEEARTLFHEFGHALHGMLSDVTYPRISGTSVSTDFVELPSQLYEHWLLTPDVLRRFAKHHETGENIPDKLLEKINAMRTFNQGFATVEYCASAIVDMDMHELPEDAASDIDPAAFEKKSLADIGMPDEIAMRHRTPHFAHIFSGDGYAAGYYSYLWSEVLDADAFSAFEETGDVFNPELAAKLKTHIYSAGGKREPDAAYIAFRGQLPTPDALMKKRGLV